MVHYPYRNEHFFLVYNHNNHNIQQGMVKQHMLAQHVTEIMTLKVEERSKGIGDVLGGGGIQTTDHLGL